ncbi:MAG TPA: hypothetical protein VLG38_08475 [Gammaproteobacteria bacterium]|nr:hypothetical protein [Gammaproteobacteria bacterium]
MQRYKTKIVLLSILSILIITPWSIRQTLFEWWMRFSLRNEHIVVSLTTTPYRVHSMRAVINFILAENIPLKALYVNIPYVFKRDNIEYVIPEYLLNDKRITVLRPNDYGPGTKLLGTLEQAKLPPDAILITVDDDIIYPKNILLYLAYKAKRNPNYAIGLSGMNPHYNRKGQIITDSLYGIGLKAVKRNNAFVAILEGFGSIAYRPKFFDASIFALENAPRECRNSDDLYISFYLAKRNVPRQVLRNKYMHLEKIGWNPGVGLNKDALHQLTPSPAERHRACVAFMKAQDPDVPF